MSEWYDEYIKTCERLNKLQEMYNNLFAEFEQYKRESVKWSWEDVIGMAENSGIEMTQQQAQEVLEEMIRKRDASIGINWDVVAVYVHLWKHNHSDEIELINKKTP